MTKILIVDDDPMFRVMMRTYLSKNQFETEDVATGAECLRKIKSTTFDLILTDLRLPDMTGIELLPKMRETIPGVPVILLTGYGDIKTAVKAIKLGAFEYVTKPANPDELLLTINNALKQKKDKSQSAVLSTSQLDFIQGETEAAKEINEHIMLVAPTNMSVLIQGESGTGKEYVAKRIHQQSKRRSRPFVAVDCGTLSKDLAASELFGHVKGAFTGAMADKKGHFQEANGGTLFLDEIGNLSYEVQVKLLRALQERKVRQVGSNVDESVDVRILAATNEDLQKAVEDGRFREDLYHRINEFYIQIAPLRERVNDIYLFSEHFLMLANKELEKEIKGFSNEVSNIFMKYNWPGNLRELKNIVKRGVLLSKTGYISLQELPEALIKQMDKPDYDTVSNGSTDLKAVAERNEREMIQKALKDAGFNKSKAARMLNIDRKTLYNKLKLYNLDY